MLKESAGRRCGFGPWVGKILWSKKWQHTPVFLSEEFHGQRSLVSYGPQGCKELDTTEHAHTARREIAGSCGSSIFSFFEKIPCCFTQWCIFS